MEQGCYEKNACVCVFGSYQRSFSRLKVHLSRPAQLATAFCYFSSTHLLSDDIDKNMAELDFAEI